MSGLFGQGFSFKLPDEVTKTNPRPVPLHTTTRSREQVVDVDGDRRVIHVSWWMRMWGVLVYCLGRRVEWRGWRSLESNHCSQCLLAPTAPGCSSAIRACAVVAAGSGQHLPTFGFSSQINEMKVNGSPAGVALPSPHPPAHGRNKDTPEVIR